MSTPRIAIVGIILESNSFAPVVDESVFRGYLYLSGEAVVKEARTPASRAPRELASFVSTMDSTGAWEPVPTVVTGSPPGGPIDHAFFESTLTEIEQALHAAGPVDGVFIANHGAMTTSDAFDGDGIIAQRVRKAVGPDVHIVMTLDLHGNISDAMVDETDCIVGYLTNPHVDQVQRGEEAAMVMRQMLAGEYQCEAVLVRLPLTPPSVTLLTREGPYADVIDFGQRRCREYGGAILNVSVFGGFVFSDTPKNGVAVVVTARNDRAVAQALADEIASFAWSIRERFTRELTPVTEAVSLAGRVATDSTLPANIYSDAGDNPGGGGSGTTTELLAALIEADATGVFYGSFFEPGVASQAHAKGVGAEIEFVLNAEAVPGTGSALRVNGDVGAIDDGDIVGRRGIFAARRVMLGSTAAIRVGASRGITIVVISQRVQTADPVMFEALGLDVADARTVVVKSRGHFRAGFDLWFAPEQVFEVDTPGYTSPVLERFEWSGLPRPVYPLDVNATFVG